MAWQNQFKTVILLALLTAILLWIGSFFGNAGLITAFVFAVTLNFLTYFFSDRIVLFMYRAKEVKKSDNPEFYETVHELAQKADLPMPRLYIIPTEAPNAFATGRNPKHAAVAATQGILKVLSKQELRGVLAHELAHVKNRDILITTIAATIAGVIGYLASMAQWAAIFGGFGGNRDDNNSLLGLLMLAILTPIIATIIQLAISRSREFLADARGASFIKDGHSLAEALEKLERSHKRIGFGSETTSSLFIVNPFKGQALWQLFSTHPPTHERIKRLRAMKF